MTKTCEPPPGPAGVLAKFVDQRLQQLVIQTVLRLFNTEKRRRRRIFEQQQIGEDLQRPVRHLLGIEGILKAPVVEAEQQAPVACFFFGIYPVNAGYLLPAMPLRIF